MRPVFRGKAPRKYARYGDALDDLVCRLDRYCSYCERRLPASLAVEHVVPKSLAPRLKTAWGNFLLGCTNCNSVKGSQAANTRGFLWPDRDNTLLAFSYRKGGFVDLAPGMTASVKTKAKSLLDIVGLDRHPKDNKPRPAKKDKRWKQRDEVWAAAELCKRNLASLGGAPEALELVVHAAYGYGFFSVWMTVFHNAPAFRAALVEKFRGTAPDCFDAKANTVSRPKGRI